MSKGASLSPITCAIFREIVAYKQAHDGNAPTMDMLAEKVELAKSNVWAHIKRLKERDILLTAPGNSRVLQVSGGRWEWATPQPYPEGRVGDVLRCVIEHKERYDGTAPSHRTLAKYLGIRYSGAIHQYLEDLAEQGYLQLDYAADRYIVVIGGQWHWDDETIVASYPELDTRQLPLL